MDIISFLTSIAKISVFVSFLLAFFLLTVQTKNKLANRLFAFYLIFFALDNSGIFIDDGFIKAHFSLEFLRWTACSLVLPFFYLYVLSVCFADFRLKPKHLLHAIPFALLNVFYLFRLYFLTNAEKIVFYSQRDQSPEMFFLFLALALQIVFYSIGAALALKRYKAIYEENYTNPKSSAFKWLLQISAIFFVLYYLCMYHKECFEVCKF